MTSFSVVGYIALIVNAIAFFPQVFKTLKTRSAAGLSSITVGILFAGSLLWFMYGTYFRDTLLMATHGLSAILTGILLYVKLVWREK
jgi:Uncharacterized conserved protein